MAPHERSGESRKPDDPQRAGESVTEKRVTTAAAAGTPNRRTAAHLGPAGAAGQRPVIPERPRRTVAELFRVDPKTVARWASNGWIGSIRTPGGHRRFRESGVRALLAERTVPAASPTA